jgi:hypothetical protein
MVQEGVWLMRGFVITVLSVSLIMILVVLATTLSNTQLSTDRALKDPLPLIYAAFLLDDIGHDFNEIAGPVIVQNETNSSLMLSVSDTLGGYNDSWAISQYGVFLSNEVASRTASNISTNLTNLTGGVITLFIDDNYSYVNDNTINETIFTKVGGTNASAYFINATVTSVRANVTPMTFNANGTLNVSILVTDINGTYSASGKVLPNQQNTLRIYYVGGGSLVITVGSQNGNSGSLLMQAAGTSAVTSWAAALQPVNANNRIGYEYNATIDYVQGNVEKKCLIGK